MSSLGELISLDFDGFKIHILAYYVHSRLHISLYVAFASIFAYHRVWSAQLEVWDEIRGSNCIFWKFWVQSDVNKKSGINAANSKLSVGLNCTIKSPGANSRGCF